jgi:hypothetical protein
MAARRNTKGSLKDEMAKRGIVGFSCTGQFSAAEKHEHLQEIDRLTKAREDAVRNATGRKK